jgi:hypothetical protein
MPSLRGAFVLAVCIALVAGCGGSSPSVSSTGSTSPTPAPATAAVPASAVATAAVSAPSAVQASPPAAMTDDLTAGGTVGPTCQVTGFDGVMANTAGNQCDPGEIAFVAGGLALTSTAGQLADDDQQNALYKTFDASGGEFTVTTRIVGPVNQLTTDYEQAGEFFGPDQKNFVKVEAEHNGSGAVHLTMFYRENGTAGIVGTVPMAALATVGTLDLVIRGHQKQLTVYYSLDGAPMVQIGTAKSPAAAATWFSASAKAGILVSNSGAKTAISATFSRFAISVP